MQTKHFRINKKEYCHITDNTIFIISSKEAERVPPAHELSEAWGIASVFNYIVFVMLFVYVSAAVMGWGARFFENPVNYGALFLLFVSFKRIVDGFVTSKTPNIDRKKITAVYLKSPKFSYPRLEIYFEGPEGKILRRTIPILYKKEAMPVLEEVGLSPRP
jgi:hypothetical protein